MQESCSLLYFLWYDSVQRHLTELKFLLLKTKELHSKFRSGHF